MGCGFFSILNSSFKSRKVIFFVETIPATTTKATEGTSFFYIRYSENAEYYVMDPSHRKMYFGFKNIFLKSLLRIWNGSFSE